MFPGTREGSVPAGGQRHQIHKNGAFGNGSHMMINGPLRELFQRGGKSKAVSLRKQERDKTTGCVHLCARHHERNFVWIIIFDPHKHPYKVCANVRAFCVFKKKKKLKKRIYKITSAYLNKQTSHTYFEVAMEI